MPRAEGRTPSDVPRCYVIGVWVIAFQTGFDYDANERLRHRTVTRTKGVRQSVCLVVCLRRLVQVRRNASNDR